MKDKVEFERKISRIVKGLYTYEYIDAHMNFDTATNTATVELLNDIDETVIIVINPDIVVYKLFPIEKDSNG